MDPRTNPFAPGAGSQPPDLAGRDDILELASIAVDRTLHQLPANSMILVGLRGTGKTVLLNRIWQNALHTGIRALLTEAHEEKSIAELLIPPLRQALFSLDAMADASNKVKRGLRVLRSFMNGVRLKLSEVEFAMDAEPGTADSGDLETDLSQLFQVVGEAAADRSTALLLCIDELQYLSERELSALIMAMHHVNQRNLPVLLVAAALPHVVALSGKSKSYSERLFLFSEIGPLNPQHATAALQNPVTPHGVRFSPAAIEAIFQKTKGYPYFLQQWGQEAWNHAKTAEIDCETVEIATASALAKLDQSFFRVRFERLSPKEKEYMRAVAGLGPGVQRTGEIAAELNARPQNVAPIRASLIRKGVLYSPAYGDTAFTVPFFGEYLMRVMA